MGPAQSAGARFKPLAVHALHSDVSRMCTVYRGSVTEAGELTHMSHGLAGHT